MMRKIDISIVTLLSLGLGLFSCKTTQVQKSNRAVERVAKSSNSDIQKSYSAQNYIDQYKDIAVKEMNENGIPASITLAQGILESSFGNSDLAKYANNHFGIKCTSTWKGKGYYKDDDQKDDCFRVYKDANESFKDHSEFLKRKRYASLFQLDKNDYVGWAKGLKQAGYATNPNYGNLLISTIEKYDLAKYDQADVERVKIARQDKIFGDINAEMAAEDAKYTPVNNAPKGIVSTAVAEKNAAVAEAKAVIDTSKKEVKSFDDGTVLKAKEIPIPGEQAVAENQSTLDTPKKENTPKITDEAGYYTVQAGDGLYKVAKQFGMSLTEIKDLNQLTTDGISVGQKLKVSKAAATTNAVIADSSQNTAKEATTIKEAPIPEVPTTQTENPKKAEEAVAEAPTTQTETPKKAGTVVSEIEKTSTYYTIQTGDSFYKIAKDFNITVDELKKLNNLTTDELKVGQDIKVAETVKPIYKSEKKTSVPTTESKPATSNPPVSDAKTYTVQKGDSLFKVAKMFNLSIDELKALNSLSTDAINVGQTLKVSK